MAMETQSRPRVTGADLAMLVFLGFVWGAQYGLTKIVLETIPPVTATAVRVGLATLVLWSVVAYAGHAVPRDARSWRDFTVHGCLALIIPGVLIAWGQLHVDSALTSVLNSTAPIFVFLITWLWSKHEPVGWQRLFGILVGLVGIVLIVGLDALNGLGRSFAGQLAIVLATFGYGMGAVWGRRFDKRPAELTAACVTTTAAVILTVLAGLLEQPQALHLSWRSAVALAVSAIVCTGIGMIFYFRLLNAIGPIGTSAVSYVKAGFGVLTGCVVLGEPFTTAIAIGLGAVAIGVAAINNQLGGTAEWLGGVGRRLASRRP